ncbi:ABC transporter permease [Salipiger thiooxidans]|uniref:ABC transporter permease n=1 Tax=Salipiger thiooxidans TaxID=282683 RepID=UPI001A904621|nr:ABC transporter permease [Salipiger thiooxidans]MBN8190282.1 ABC transporter permease [Salipiger thiooxidans]
MMRFILSRIAMGLPTLFLAAAAVFFLMRLIPGDPAALMLGDMATPTALASLRSELGLDKPIFVQFFLWLQQIATGDFGTSITNGQPVLPQILDRFAISGMIVVVSVTLAALIAVPAGMIAAWYQDSALDFSLIAVATLLLSIPTFWLGLLLLLFFGLKLGWLPVIGFVMLNDDFKAGLLYLALPVMTLVMHEIGVLIRMARSSMLEVQRLDYIMHARAKGLSEPVVLWRHAFRNAFAPTWTLIGLILGNLLGGIAVVETVFTIPGLGRLLVDSIFARDYPVVQGCLLFIAATYVVVNLIVDLCYPIFDPRVTLD